MAYPIGERPYKIIFAAVAQLVEQLIRNQQVDGSNPPGGFVNWPIFFVCPFQYSPSQYFLINNPNFT
jgi:hypothetical protein